MNDDRRADAVSDLLRELTQTVRSTSVRAQAANWELTLVEYSILELVSRVDGCQVKDVVAQFNLEKSTVSRQVSAMERSGLVTKADRVGRGVTLVVTEHGRSRLAAAQAERVAALRDRVGAWETGDVEALAVLLGRYNSAAEPDG